MPAPATCPTGRPLRVEDQPLEATPKFGFRIKKSASFMPKKVKKPTAARKRRERREWEKALIAEIRHRRALNSFARARAKVPKNDVLSVYPSYRDNTFPVHTIQNKSVPKWRYLSQWIKVFAATWVMNENGERCLAFSINLHPLFESELIAKPPPFDVRAYIRNGVSRELRKVLKEPPTFYFVLEGRSRDFRSKTPLHIHGGMWAKDPSQDDAIRLALKRACGHYIKGRFPMRSAARLQPAYGLVNRWASYCMKTARIRDDRLAKKRVAMSQPLTQAAEKWWKITIGEDE